MNEEITIYRGDRPIINAIVNAGSSRTYQLMETDEITLNFSTLKNVAPKFIIGDHCDVEGERFVVNEHYSPNYSQATGGYDYQLKMEAEYRTWKNYVVKNAKLHNGRLIASEVTWKYTAQLHEHIKQILVVLTMHGQYTADLSKAEGLDELNKYIDIDSQYFSIDNRDNMYKLMEYDGTNIIDALNTLCSAEKYDCEWWCTRGSDGRYTIHIGRRQSERSSPFVIETAVNAASISLAKTEYDYANRLYVYGGSQNVPYSYRKTVWFTNSEDNTTLRDNTCELTHKMVEAAQRDTTYDRSADFWKQETSIDSWVLVYDYDIYAGNIAKGKYAIKGSKIRFYHDFVLQQASQYGFVDKLSIYLEARTWKDGRQEVRWSKDYHAQITQKIVGYDPTTPGTPLSEGSSSNMYLTDEEFTIVDDTENFNLHAVIQVEFIIVGSGINPNHPDLRIGVEGANIFYRKDYYHGACKVRIYGTESWIDATYEETYYYKGRITPNDTTVIGKDDRYEVKPLVYTETPISYYTPDDGEDVINGLSELRLRLPLETPYSAGDLPKNVYLKDGYVELQDGNGVVEMVVVHDEIFPSVVSMPVGRVTAEPRKAELIFPDASASERNYNVYTLHDTYIENNPQNVFKTSYILDNVTLQVKFNTGLLAGMAFDVQFDEDEQTYLIVPNQNYGTLLPNDTLRPNPGDEVLLIGWDVRAIHNLGMIDDAESRLFAAALDDLEKYTERSKTYNVEMYSGMDRLGRQLLDSDKKVLKDKDGLYLKSNDGPVFPVGQNVILRDYALFGSNEDGSAGSSKPLRIVGYERKLDIDFDAPRYIVGEIVRPSRLKQLENNMKTWKK